jgi:hypothetical protein
MNMSRKETLHIQRNTIRGRRTAESKIMKNSRGRGNMTRVRRISEAQGTSSKRGSVSGRRNMVKNERTW